MQVKHIILLGVIFLALLAAVLAKSFFMKPPVEITEYKHLEISFAPAGIHAVEMKNLATNALIKLERKGDDWFIPSRWDVRGDKGRIEHLMNQLKELSGEVRSTSPELLDDYGIGDNEAFSLTMFDEEGRAQETLLIGIDVPAGGGVSFLRKAGSADVYLVDKDVFSLIGVRRTRALDQGVLNVDHWVDLALARIDAPAVNALKISRCGEPAAAVDIKKEFDEEKKLNRWVAQGKQSRSDLDAEKIKGFISGINNLRGQQAVDPQGGDYGFDQPFLSVRLETDKDILEFFVGKEKEEGMGDRYLKTPSGHVYFTQRNVIDQLNIDVTQFFVDEPQED